MPFRSRDWAEMELALMVDAYDSDTKGSADVPRDSIREGNYDEELTQRQRKSVLAILDMICESPMAARKQI